ncbi:LppU/SCO3897 family protein [Modestobacter lapidis]|nr:hypothetical protein [Modestobacter lapidis]
MSTPQGGEGQGPYGRGPQGPGRVPQSGNKTPLIIVGSVVIAVCVVVLFALSGGGGSTAPRLQAGDCLASDGTDPVPCDDAEAAYRVLETRDDVPEADAPVVCGAVPGVVAFGWEGEAGGTGTAYCLGAG